MVKRMQQQAGGTLLGLIVGLIIGLGIAVVVAIAITKTPMPFVNKMARSDRPNGDKLTDPNRPLYGKRDPAKEAARTAVAPTQAAAVAPAAAVESQPPENTASPAAADRAPIIDKSISAADSAQKVETVALTKAADAKPSAQNVDDKYTYYLQAGAFREQMDADNTRGKLALMGFEARVTERPSETGTLYRVRIGPFSQMEAMSRTRAELSDNGVDVAVVRMPK